MLKDTLAKFFKVDTLIENLTGFVETRVELLKLEVKEDLSKGLAKVVAYLAIAFIVALFLIFLSVAVAFLIGESLGNFAGFSIVAGVYLMGGLVLWVSRNNMIAKLEDKFSLMFRKKT